MAFGVAMDTGIPQAKGREKEEDEGSTVNWLARCFDYHKMLITRTGAFGINSDHFHFCCCNYEKIRPSQRQQLH